MSGILFVCVCRGVSFVARDVCKSCSCTVECYGYQSLVSRASLTSKESGSGRLRHTSISACQNLGRANENGVLNHVTDIM